MNKKNISVSGKIKDIAVQKKTEEKLRKTHPYLEKLINYSNALIIAWNPKFEITLFNHAFERLTNYKAKQVIGNTLRVLFSEDTVMKSLNKIKHTIQGEDGESVEIPVLCKDGKKRTALWNLANVYAADGKTLVSTIAHGIDVTERKKAEGLLRKSEEKYRALIETNDKGRSVTR